MSVHHEVAMRHIITAADALGVALPTDIDPVIRHAVNVQIVAPSEATVVTELLSLVGDPVAFDRAAGKACDRLARANVAVQLQRAVAPRAVSKAWAIVARERDRIAAAFGDAMQPHIDALTEHSPHIPDRATEATAASLSPAVFTHWRAATTAAAALETAWKSLHSLYRDGTMDNALSLETIKRLIVCEVPDLASVEDAIEFRAAVSGHRELGGNLSVTQYDTEGAWFARVVGFGVGFSWATPDPVGAAPRIAARGPHTACRGAWRPGIRTAVMEPRNGSTRQWRAVRARILRRYVMCQICGAKPSTVVDHIVPLSRGGRLLDPLNLQGACWDCNSRKSNLLPGEDGRCPRQCECGRRSCTWLPRSRDW